MNGSRNKRAENGASTHRPVIAGVRHRKRVLDLLVWPIQDTMTDDQGTTISMTFGQPTFPLFKAYHGITSLQCNHSPRWWIGWIEEVPGVNSQGATREELMTNLREALSEALEMNRHEARNAAGPDFEEVAIQT